MTNLNTELGPKRLELLRELMPTANDHRPSCQPDQPPIAETVSQRLQSTARTLGLQLHILNASNESDFDTIFCNLGPTAGSALVIAPDALFISRSEQLAALTVRHAVPAITQFAAFAAAGGLMSYGSGLRNLFSRLASTLAEFSRGRRVPIQPPANEYRPDRQYQRKFLRSPRRRILCHSCFPPRKKLETTQEPGGWPEFHQLAIAIGTTLGGFALHEIPEPLGSDNGPVQRSASWD